MVLSAAVLGGFIGDSVPPRHGILAFMGSAVSPVSRDDRRTVLELKVRDPWNSQDVFQHDPRRVQEPDGLQQNIWQRSGTEPSLRGGGPNPEIPTSAGRWLSGRGTTVPRNPVPSKTGTVSRGRSWFTLDNGKSRKFEIKRRITKTKRRTKPSSGKDDQELGEVEPSLSVRERARKVTSLAKDVSWRRNARKELEEGFYSSNTSASKCSKRKKITDMAEACVGRGKVFPVELTTLLDVAALLKKINMKASEQYLYELKAMNSEFGFEWSSQMEAHFKMCKRSLSRDRGPEVRALELKPQDIPEHTLFATTRSKTKPRKIGLCFVWASTWMLRAIEAQGVKVGRVKIDHVGKTVKLWIPKSKMDQRALGVSRTLGCECKDKCRTLCPYALAVACLAEHRGDNPKAFLFPNMDGEHVSQFNMVKSWSDHLMYGVSGHSARRSGAMMYARGGMSVQEIAYLGRWKSSAIFRYVEQALQDVPLNISGKFCPGSDLKEVKMEEEKAKAAKPRMADNKLKEKLDHLTGRVKVLEEDPQRGETQKLPKQLWAVSNQRNQRVAHLVVQASWNLPLESWATSCGWRFARKNVKVCLTRETSEGMKICEKCQEHNKLRDEVNCGVSLAQLVDI